MYKDLHDNVKAVRSIAPVAVGVTGTGTAGKAVDRSGYNAVEIIASYGSITATNAVFTLTIKEGDATGSMTSVADADLLGLEANAVARHGHAYVRLDEERDQAHRLHRLQEVRLGVDQVDRDGRRSGRRDDPARHAAQRAGRHLTLLGSVA